MAFQPGAFQAGAFQGAGGAALRAAPLEDLVPGNLGLMACSSSIILLPFDESTAIQPSDALGNLDDLGTEAGLVAPQRVSAWTGFGRRFVQSANNGLIAADKAGRRTLLQRDVTIQALLSLTLTGATGPQTLLVRGANDGTISERYAYGIELQEQVGRPGMVEVRWFWQDDNAAVRTQMPGVFRSPGDGVEFLLTATRRWESTTRVVLRYYVADVQIAEVVSTDGSISGGTTGRTIVGARKTAGAFSRFFNGTLDELLVNDNEVSLEEIRHTWRRLTEYQPGGVETFAALTPPGSVWARNAGNDIGKRVKLVGQLLGLAVAGAEEIRALSLPDAAPLERIGRWEAICDQSAAPGDSLDVRRTRVASYLAREEGFSVPAIKQALSGPMDLPPEQIEIIEYDHTVTDDFATLSGPWLNSMGSFWSVSGGELRTNAPAGSSFPLTSTIPFLLTPAAPGRLYVAAKLSSFAQLSVGVFAGLALHNRVTSDWLWFGVFNDAGTKRLVWRATSGAFATLAAPSTNGPYWLRIATSQEPGFVADGLLTLSFSTTGPDTGFTEAPINTGITSGWGWAGFALFTTITPASATAVSFDDFVLHNADSLRPYAWYAFRDPTLPGRADVVGAHRLVQKIKPAYTHAAAIMSRRLICGDPRDGLCGVGPL